jgi:hypothetical protein
MKYVLCEWCNQKTLAKDITYTKWVKNGAEICPKCLIAFQNTDPMGEAKTKRTERAMEELKPSFPGFKPFYTDED